MAEFRTASGLISCDVFVRTATGLVQVDPQFRTATGVIDAGTQGGGSGATFSATASPAQVYGSIARKVGGNVVTNATTVTPAGGVGGYTFAWSTAENWTVSAPASATTTFSSIVGPGDQKSAEFTCTVTDSKGGTAIAIVYAEVANYYSGGGGIQNDA